MGMSGGYRQREAGNEGKRIMAMVVVEAAVETARVMRVVVERILGKVVGRGGRLGGLLSERKAERENKHRKSGSRKLTSRS